MSPPEQTEDNDKSGSSDELSPENRYENGLDIGKLDDSEDSTQEQQPSSPDDDQKIELVLKPAGNAPIMKKSKWKVDKDKQIAWVMGFIRKYLGLPHSDSMFLYVNQTFAPSPDQTLGNLYRSFGYEGKLTLHYSQAQAWG